MTYLSTRADYDPLWGNLVRRQVSDSDAARPRVTLTALAVTMAAMAAHSARPSAGTTTPDLWPADARPPIRDTRDIDDWLAIVAAGGGVGITPEGTTAQYRRDGVVFRLLRDAPLITVQVIWRQHDPHPSTHAAVALLAELYRRPT